MDSQFIWNAAFSIGMTGIGALTALGAKYLKEVKESLQERIDKQYKTIDQIRDDYKNDLCAVSGKIDTAQEDLGKFKIEVQRDFVNREEYIRTTQSLDAKIDKVLGEIGKIQVNMAKLAAAQEVKNK